MASKQTDDYPACLMCFEPKYKFKIVGHCKHTFCLGCLTKHVQKQNCVGEMFPCPVCQVDYPLPSDGLVGLKDFTGVEDITELLNLADIQPGTKPSESDEAPRLKIKKDVEALVEVKCLICHHSGLTVDAHNFCLQCDQLHLCDVCTETHRRNKATRHHTVIPFKTRTLEEVVPCDAHGVPVTNYCTECNRPACMVCVTLIHGDHDVVKLETAIRSEEINLKDMLDIQEKQMKSLNYWKHQLSVLNVLAPTLDERRELKKSIEDQAQKCIDHVTAWKEGLIQEVNEDFDVIDVIPKELILVTKRMEKRQVPISNCSRLVAQSKQNPLYLEKLISSRQALEESLVGDDNTDIDRYRECLARLKKLSTTNHTFAAENFLLNLGKLEKANDFTPIPIFKNEMISDSDDTFMYIPCVANMERFFAVAHPICNGEHSTAVDIFEFPSTFKKTIKDGIGPVIDMSSTLDGKLAVLSTGGEPSTSSVKLYDPLTGTMISSLDIKIGRPISLGVNVLKDYAILSEKENNKKCITVMDKRGGIVNELRIEPFSEMCDPERITFAGMCSVVVIGRNLVKNYNLSRKADGLKEAGLINYNHCIIKDVSYTKLDQKILCEVTEDDVMCLCRTSSDFRTVKAHLPVTTSLDKVCRVAAGLRYIVLSVGKVVTVYRY